MIILTRHQVGPGFLVGRNPLMRYNKLYGY
jgi:hypothetical protein